MTEVVARANIETKKKKPQEFRQRTHVSQSEMHQKTVCKLLTLDDQHQLATKKHVSGIVITSISLK